MYEELGKYFSNTGPTTLGPNAKDVAKFIVLNADVKRTPLQQKSSGGPSLMSRIFDILSRPNYAVANLVKGLVDRHDNPLKDIISGLAGTQKTTFGQILKEHNLGTPTSQAIAGLILDIGLDPTTYIGAGTVGKLGKLGKLGKVERTAETALPLKPKNIVELPRGEAPAPFRETFNPPPVEGPLKVGLPSRQLELDLPDLLNAPEAAARASREVPVSSVDEIAPVAGQIPMKFPDFKVSGVRKAADETIEDLPANLEKVVPVPKPVPAARDLTNADALLSRFKAPKDSILTPAHQVRLYNDAIKLTRQGYKKPAKARTATGAIRTLIAAEDKLRRQGFRPHDGVWLSDVIIKAGPEVVQEFAKGVKSGSPAWQAVQDLRATAAVQDAGPVQKIAENIQQTKVNLEAGNQLSDAQLNRVKGLLSKIGKESAKAAGVTPVAEDAAVKLVKTALMAGESRAQIAVQQAKHMLDDVVATGKANPKANHVLTMALEKDLGTLPAWAVTENNAVEFMMGRVATWWGQKDLRPLSLNQIASSISTAAARGQALDHMFAGMNVADRAEVFRLAQGIPGLASKPEIHVLAQQVARMMDNLIGRAAGTSVVTRAGVSMDLLNKWMKQYKVGFLFERSKVKNYVTGEIHDLSKGKDWLDTWKHVELPGDCKTCMFKLQQALEQATREKALYDEIGERFGSRAYGNGYRVKIEGHPYLEGYYFTDDIAKQLPRVIRDWTTPGFQGGKGLLGLYDRVLSMWKAGVTIYRPGHHIRNMVGDVYLGWMDGVNSVRPYKLAAQVQRSMAGLYTNLMNVDRLVELGALGKDFRTPMPGRILFTNRSGIGFTAEQIGAVAHQKGLLEHARTIEDIIDLGGEHKLLDAKPFGGKVQRTARGASELQSHNARLAHFIDKVIKSRGTDLESIFEEASRRARKWHPTGLDMTSFEKKVLRRIIPFYSWLRKSTPLLIEGLVMNPGKAVIPSKVYGAIQQAQGIETPGRQDPFPVDQMFPEWIRQEGVGPIGLPGEGLLAKLSNQQPPGYTMAGMGLNPLTQLVASMKDPGRTLATGLTPAIQVPLELATGRKIFTGEPITGPESRPGSFRQYIGEQIPVFGSLQNVLGFTPFGSETKSSAKSDGQARTEALANWLSGGGIRGTGPYKAQARYEALAPAKMARKIGREQFLSQLREQLNGNS